jgi:phosphotransferase system HPr-like phosphotransfer protein
MMKLVMEQKKNHFKLPYRYLSKKKRSNFDLIVLYRKHGETVTVYVDSKDETKVLINVFIYL